VKEWVEHIAHMIVMRSAPKILVGKREKRPLRRPKPTWEDNIKMHVREIELEGVDWIHWTQDRDQWQALVNMVMNLWAP
jgi:hypothetical protein